jgi:hypothetical protein
MLQGRTVTFRGPLPEEVSEKAVILSLTCEGLKFQEDRDILMSEINDIINLF